MVKHRKGTRKGTRKQRKGSRKGTRKQRGARLFNWFKKAPAPAMNLGAVSAPAPAPAMNLGAVPAVPAVPTMNQSKNMKALAMNAAPVAPVVAAPRPSFFRRAGQRIRNTGRNIGRTMKNTGMGLREHMRTVGRGVSLNPFKALNQM